MSIDSPSVAAALAAAPIDDIYEAHWAETAVTVLATTVAVLVVSVMAVIMSLA